MIVKFPSVLSFELAVSFLSKIPRQCRVIPNLLEESLTVTFFSKAVLLINKHLRLR